MICRGDKIKNQVFAPDKFYNISEVEPIRSNDQNAYLHGWVYPTIQKRFEQEGEKVNEVQIHELMKYLFLRKRKKCPITKRYRTVEGSTAKLSKKAFTVYVESIEQWYFTKFNEGFPTCPYSKDLLYYQSLYE